MNKKVVIIGAGPAGLTAAYELLKNSNSEVIIFEMSPDIGGLSKTIVYKGNRIDIGGHRFFSKSEKVMDWWQAIMPVQGKPARDDLELGRKITFPPTGNVDPEKTNRVMLIRERLSRIFFLRSFFDYPISLKWSTFKNLGFLRLIKIGWTYVLIKLQPIKNEKNLEEFLINRFGKELYNTFFKDYTEKVWGVPCSKIPADWGAQRIKGLSISKTLIHAIKNVFFKDNSIRQKNTETSLIEQFLYPKLGPGQLWEEVACKIEEMGGCIERLHEVIKVDISSGIVTGVHVKNTATSETLDLECDCLISTMPIKTLVNSMPSNEVPIEINSIASGLVYRDFITVGLLLKRMQLTNDTKRKTINDVVPDNWIYIQERDVKIGRLQIFNNWSPYLVANEDNVWIGLEYFCNEGDELWEKEDSEFISFAINELEKINMIMKEDVLDSTIIRIPKTYPAYFGTYNRFAELIEFTDKIENLFLIGRNGMHRYNNADHSMLTAMAAVKNICSGIKTKHNIWDVNVEKEYNETKQ
ncbi:NAD(P)/FAD-dependent oxidoreductase [Desulfopila sp. IMCC35008]|uniref:NAD(P)/FAD-dependent oxidoreductase n=1 Tax=Desulfopila sp. IMCC35008 TaxID=2653858 RepID=UPI0013D119D5|nr:NAD(P)/FAD-dependent oxidoreductase [Desulfopila sp. IMCC35008]